MNAVVRFFVERGLLVNLVSVLVLALGIYTMFAINREAFPNVNLDMVEVNVAYPGATPEEIEHLVITPIEQEIKSLDGINKMISVAFPGSGRVILELDPRAKKRDRMASDVQLAVDRAVLPKDLPASPSVLEVDGAVFPIIQLAIGAKLSPLELKRLGDKIEDDLLNIKGVARVVVQGDRKAEFRVVVDPDKMKQARISVAEVAALLNNWNVNAPGGDMQTKSGQKSVRVVGEFRSSQDIANLVLRANEVGGGIRLGDIAKISESLEDARVYYDVSGEPALSVLVLKKADADIINTVDLVREYIKSIPDKYGANIVVTPFQDFSRFARLRLGVLTSNGIMGLALVFISLLVFLRPAVAFTTTWGLPVIFCAGLATLYFGGVTLNLISMLGFIIVLGMLVDDAIIVGENITYHMEQGMHPKDAAVLGASELMGPVAASVFTTIVAFLPMMFMSGMIGKFIVAIPVVVISLLFFSWLESFSALPAHVAAVARPHAHPKERWLMRTLERMYMPLLELAVRNRWKTTLLSILMLIGSFVVAKHSDFQLFPAAGVDQYIVRVIAPPGISLEDMRKKMQLVDKEIRQRTPAHYLETTLISTGQIAQDSGDPLQQRGSRFGQIRVLYTPAVTRPDHNVIDDLKRSEHEIPKLFPGIDIAFAELRAGPPTGRPLEVEITGFDYTASTQVAGRLMKFLNGIEGVTSVESGLQPGDDEVHVVMDRTLAAYAGVNLATAASHVRAAVGGLRVTTTRRGTEEVDITIRYPENIDQFQALRDILIPNQRGGLVPLSKIVKFEQSSGFSTIRHKDGVRVLSVTANIDSSKITSIKLNKLVADAHADWVGDAVGKVDIKFGGEAEKNAESMRGLAFSFLFAMVGIFFILALQFNNFSYPLVVMLAIPFGVIGIIVSFYLHNAFWHPTPLSFFAFMGMVALSGVVVNSSLVLLVFIQRALQEGVHYVDAILQAGRRRLRAVVLTSATTVFGLLPTAYGWGGSDPFVAPMALALAWGLIFATLITLLMIPAIYAAGVDVKVMLRAFLSRFQKK